MLKTSTSFQGLLATPLKQKSVLKVKINFLNQEDLAELSKLSDLIAQQHITLLLTDQLIDEELHIYFGVMLISTSGDRIETVGMDRIVSAYCRASPWPL